MIVLDTHTWIWWVHGDSQLPQTDADFIKQHESDAIGVSAISCWELAKLYQYQRINLSCELSEWLDLALNYPGLRLLPLTPAIAVESTRLPGIFHRDPADQIIVATARIHDCPLVTQDAKILAYPHVKKPAS